MKLHNATIKRSQCLGENKRYQRQQSHHSVDIVSVLIYKYIKGNVTTRGTYSLPDNNVESSARIRAEFAKIDIQLR